ncbi:MULTISPECIES: tRNA (adenosine(37)-N6)-threonylcarbamoyltransferase complex ATPase subunit type 1 TsaE [Psychrobacter]|jgi:tRNA threonylcarbamoyladenosine biosynthesis protein TsaE|uniref:tRNA (adenosine(37)-N6)-threonylcarbamoyltransferase complex ATPase subunit type 1 TsaE n=1 Tax=Psychrobacter TaxID=497 RepID=UPI00191A67B6|nr:MULTISPECIES: tRNA (adenosine(37)-N6)-threonylcarbamoyltransferase complex ATPase subunit type 1 TsaE [Psychrobacter]MCG3871359.1 tRNA (adenosine(37)-N6)-threonylcarbamoyltransferase complex ATPase subunit type 1 TsaE [Psychrobacter sp. Ps7]
MPNSTTEDKNAKTLTLYTEADTQRLAAQLAALPLTGSVWLAGDLGAGKTTLTRYWLQALGHAGAVKSPTYTLVEPYSIEQTDGSVKPVYHADLYRLQDPEELSFIGFDEYLDEPNALVIIEWASRADSYLPPPTLFIDMTQATSTDKDNESRQVELRLSKAGQAQGLDLSSVKI